jgi:23S rRNA (guanosine2251-2'-O)-methyltransferase
MKEWIVGRNPVYETLRAGRRHFFQLLIASNLQEKTRLNEIRDLAQRHKLTIEGVARHRLDALGSGHQGVALEASGYNYSVLPDILERAAQIGEPPFVLILDALHDPQNLGTLLRTAEIVGVHGVLLPLRQTVTVTPAVVSASSGASEHLLVAQVNLAQAISELKENGLWVIGLEHGVQSQSPEKLRLEGPIALVVGSEGQGMRALVRDSCDLLMRLPMRGRIESLNAATAGSVALYLVWQQRDFSGSE